MPWMRELQASLSSLECGDPVRECGERHALFFYSTDNGSTVDVTFGLQPECEVPPADVFAVDYAGCRMVHITDPPRSQVLPLSPPMG